MGVTNGPARTHRETAALAKKSFFSVVTPTFVDGAFVALNMINILPVGPITISVFFLSYSHFSLGVPYFFWKSFACVSRYQQPLHATHAGGINYDWNLVVTMMRWFDVVMLVIGVHISTSLHKIRWCIRSWVKLWISENGTSSTLSQS